MKFPRGCTYSVKKLEFKPRLPKPKSFLLPDIGDRGVKSLGLV